MGTMIAPNFVPLRIKRAMQASKRVNSSTVTEAKLRADKAAREYGDLLKVVDDKQSRGVRVPRTLLAKVGDARERMMLRQDELEQALAGKLHFYRALPEA